MKLDLQTPPGRAIAVFLAGLVAGPLGLVAAAIGLVLRDLTEKYEPSAR